MGYIWNTCAVSFSSGRLSSSSSCTWALTTRAVTNTIVTAKKRKAPTRVFHQGIVAMVGRSSRQEFAKRTGQRVWSAGWSLIWPSQPSQGIDIDSAQLSLHSFPTLINRVVQKWSIEGSSLKFIYHSNIIIYSRVSFPSSFTELKENGSTSKINIELLFINLDIKQIEIRQKCQSWPKNINLNSKLHNHYYLQITN